jgi:transcriptional regulator with PAS, ATPase and Fis domain
MGEQMGFAQHWLADYGRVRHWAIQSLFDTLDRYCEGTVIVDHSARIAWINAGYAVRFGFADPAEAIGRPVEEVIPNSLLREVVNSGRPILLDLMQADNEPLVVTRLPLRDDQGQLVGAIGFALIDELRTRSPLLAKFARLSEELAVTRASLAETRRAKYSFDSFIGNSPPALAVKRQARRAAEMDSPVLLLGATGTGKEVLAHAIHAASPRAHKPLVTLNMAAIPETLLEAELFGASAGAYTGADRKGRIGKFQLADGGTLFLDEIGDLPPALQVKLLRVLQDKEFEALGSNKVQRSDVRIIAATSVYLKDKVARGEFRADLFFRLNVLSIEVPPLAERLSDLPALCDALLAEFAHSGRMGRYRLTPAAFACLQGYGWPGNVRELRNILERAIMLADGATLDADDVAPLIGQQPADVAGADRTGAYHQAMAAFEASLLREALAACHGHVPSAAARLGIGRATLYKKLAAHRIKL